MAHVARAALESIAFQSTALLQAMVCDAVAQCGAAVVELRVDGGACINDFLMQFQADLLGISVVRSLITETTVLGAGYLAGLATGVYQSKQELATLWKVDRRFSPHMSPEDVRANAALGIYGSANGVVVSICLCGRSMRILYECLSRFVMGSAGFYV